MIYAFLTQLTEEQYPIIYGQKNMSKDKNNPPLEEEIPLDDPGPEEQPTTPRSPEYYEESTDYSVFGFSSESKSESESESKSESESSS